MLQWTPYAFVRFVFVFIAGVLIGIYFPGFISYSLAEIALITLIALFVVIVLIPNVSIPVSSGVIGLTALFLAGYCNVGIRTQSRQPDHYLHYGDSISFYKAIVSTYPEEKDKAWKMTANVTSVITSQGWQACSGKVLLYFSKNDFSDHNKYGDALLIKGRPEPINPPANPHEFDYKRFLSYRTIYHQHFLRQGDVQLVGHEPPSSFVGMAMKIRSWSNQVLKKYVEGTQEQAIASALVLGVVDGLDNDLLNAYAASGAMHVLAVSGLHIGIVYWLLLLLLKPLRKSVYGRWILAFLSLFILWLYAFVTGLSPSVLRAVVMFSVVALAEPWGKRTNIYNTLAVSALCLLLYDPYLIMSVGFQLSYLAVIGIVYLYPKVYGWWQPGGWLLDKIWQITAVSLAAQIVTFPVGLLYFHQFPVYFLFSNLVVIPLSFLVLILGLLLLAVSFFAPASAALGFCLTLVIKGLNKGVFITESLPFSLINDIYLTTAQCLLLMGVIVALTLLFVRKKFVYMWPAVAMAIVFSIIQWQRFVDVSATTKIIAYKVPGHSAFDLMAQHQAYFFADSALLLNEESIRFHIRPNRVAMGIKSIADGRLQPFVRNMPGCRLVVWKGHTLLFLRKDFIFVQNYAVDYLIVSDNALKDVSLLQDKIKCKLLIIDSSNSYYVSNKLEQQAERLGVNTYAVLRKGAFEINI